MRMGVVMVLATLAIPPLYQGLAQSLLPGIIAFIRARLQASDTGAIPS
jgi:hypothetical protein